MNSEETDHRDGPESTDSTRRSTPSGKFRLKIATTANASASIRTTAEQP